MAGEFQILECFLLANPSDDKGSKGGNSD